jgi:hypothetical protein
VFEPDFAILSGVLTLQILFDPLFGTSKSHSHQIGAVAGEISTVPFLLLTGLVLDHPPFYLICVFCLC